MNTTDKKTLANAMTKCLIVVSAFFLGFYCSACVFLGMVTSSTSNADSLRALEALCYLSYAKNDSMESVKERAIKTVASIYEDQLMAKESNYIYKKLYYSVELVAKIEKNEEEFPDLKAALEISRQEARRQQGN
jgi:hypothetical protein